MNALYSLLVFFSFFVKLCFCDNYGVYPSSYPFDDNTFLPIPKVTKAIPTFDFENVDSDPGGYFYIIYTPRGSFNSYPGPLFMPTLTGFIDYNCFLVFGVPCSPAFMPISVWNCTALNFVVEPNWFDGKFNNYQVCDSADCCQETFGTLSIFDLKSINFFFSGWEAQSTSGYCCPDAITPALYCALRLTPGWCMERYINRVERTVVLPCLDNIVYYFIASCPAFRAIGVWGYLLQDETPLYISSGTHMDSYIIRAIRMESTFDFVCYPYSYYHPEGLMSETYQCSSVQRVNALLFVLFGILYILS